LGLQLQLQPLIPLQLKLQISQGRQQQPLLHNQKAPKGIQDHDILVKEKDSTPLKGNEKPMRIRH
jgi:hypothetical protein